jgi:hypothetical protein
MPLIKPDYVEGLRRDSYAGFPIDEIPGAILHKQIDQSLILPHFAGEWKAAGKSLGDAGRQSGYDGAGLVYARNEALVYMGKHDPPGHAAVFTFTTDGRILIIYAHYEVAGEDGAPRYCPHPIATIGIVDSAAEFNRDKLLLRAVQDYARKQSYKLMRELKNHWSNTR